MSSKRNAYERLVGAVLEPVGFTYECTNIQYNIPARYTPDFRHGNILVECKGYFRKGDRQKYKAISKACREQGFELVFLLYNHKKKCSKWNNITMGEWCTKEGIRWSDDPAKLVEWAKGTAP